MSLRQRLLATAACGLAVCALGQAAHAQNIAENQTVKMSTIGSGSEPTFNGGTLEMDQAGTYPNNFLLTPSTASQLANTIDTFGTTSTLSGIFADQTAGIGGNLTITNSGSGGSVIFTGLSTYSGPTTINSGATLALAGTGSIATSASVTVNGTYDISATSAGAEVVTLEGTGTVNLGAQTLRIDGGSTTFSGVIQGTGGLTITGGEQILDGANTYTGGTSITSNGALQIGNSDTSGSIVGNVTNAGVLAFERTDNITFSQTVTGAGNVTQAGTGILTFNTVQPYTGITTISAGTLALSGAASIAASSGVSDTGTFDISGTNAGASIKSLEGTGFVTLGGQTLTITNATGIFSGVISDTGGGALVLNGGNEVLSGNNTYTGGTTINGGTLQIGGGATTGSVIGNIVDGTSTTAATVAFDYSNAQAFTSVISGTGGMKLVSGTLTLSAAQTYTGPTTISTGTLVLASGASIAASSGVTANGTLDISQTGGASITALSGNGIVQLGSGTTTSPLTITSGSGTFSGVIEGTNSVTLNSGTEVFSGANTYTGNTVIGSAAKLSLLQINGLASSPVVDNGALDVSGATNNLSNIVLVSIPSLAGSGSVVLGTNTLVLTNAAGTFSGVISGSSSNTGTGGVTVSSGTETLTGANTFTGTLAIGSGAGVVLSGNGSLSSSTLVSLSSQGTSVGTLDLSSAAGAVTFGSLAGQGSVTLGANSLTLASGNGDFSGVISGSGGLTVSGGTQILSGANTYTGGTSITGGTLQLGDGGTGGTIIGNVADGGTLAFDYSGTTTFSGTISGSGGVNQLGAGTTVLTATNTYTGGTTITGGTLQIGNGGTIGSIPGNVTDNGTLAFDFSGTATFAGTVSGSGGVSQVGGGTLILSAVNTYTGATSIASGSVLQLGAANSIAASSQVTDNGTFDVSNNTAPQVSSLAGSGTVTLGSQTLTLTNGSTSFSGAITGTGGLIVSGGTQTLAGTNSYTGATAVNGGTLSVTGSIASSSGVTVNSGGTLGGTGTVPVVTVNSGGTLAPGVSGKGTLNVNGPLTFASGSTLLIDASSTSSPSVAVSGNASLAGTLAVSSVDGTYPVGQKLTVLTATGNVSGSFTAAAIPALNTSGGAQFTPAVSTDAHDVFLQINLSKLSPLLPSGETRNGTNAVAGIDAALAKGSTPSMAFDNLGNLSSAALGTDAQQLAGQLGGDIPLLGNAMYAPFENAVFDHISDIGLQHQLVHHAALQSGPEAWLAVTGNTDIVSGNPADGSSKFSSSGVGLVGGADWHLTPNMLLGAALSVDSTHFHVGNGMGTGKATAVQGGVYGFMQFTPHIYGSFLGAFGDDNVTTSRTITVAGTDTLGASFNSQVFGGRYETGINLGWIIPYAAAEDRLVRTPSYGESATAGTSNFALNYGSNSINTPDIELGARQVADIPVNANWTMHLSDRLGWEHALYPSIDAPASFIGLPGPDFTTFGAQPAKDSALLSLGAQFRSRYGLIVALDLEDAVSSKSESYNGMFTLGMGW